MIHPLLTIGETLVSERFCGACLRALEKHVPVSAVRSVGAVAAINPLVEDALVFFNCEDACYNGGFLELLEQARNVGTDLYPIALVSNARRPPDVLPKGQSFDVVEELRHRRLTADQVETVATALARTIVCNLQPTLTKDRLNLFISYRRFDGEELAAVLCAQLRVRAENVFRDLIDIRVGKDAQEVIEERLRSSDTVIFLDTPKAGESEWIATELTSALALDLPIVWVRLGSEEFRTPLKVVPGSQPHFTLSETDPREASIGPRLIDELIDTAFAIGRRSAQAILEDIGRVKRIARDHNLLLQEIDHKALIYKLEIPRRGGRYRQRPLTHVLQFFGRWPSTEDVKALAVRAASSTREVYPLVYDAVVLLAPIPPQPCVPDRGDVEFVDSSKEYVSSLLGAVAPPRDRTSRSRRGLIISGSFPDCEPQYQQQLTDALHAFVHAVLTRGGIVIFGGHPTFQHLVLDLAKRRRPSDSRQAIHLYLSRYFVTDSVIQEAQENATVYPIDSVGNKRAASLTAMRTAMIADSEAQGVVIIGGKTRAAGRQPGVDEEIALARTAGLPVFLVGSAGGRAAEVASVLSVQGWNDALNGLPPVDNEQLLRSLDYHDLAMKVLDEVRM